MRIGLDIDGVLANFFTSYERAFIEITGRDRFGHDRWPQYIPDDWNWPQNAFGYTQQEASAVWFYIKNTDDFWCRQSPLPGMFSARRLADHELYFITDRPGKGAKRATELWLREYGPFENPTVLISRNGKGPIVAGLGLELYIDDKVENIISVQTYAPECASYLAPIFPYAENNLGFKHCRRRCRSVEDVLKLENL
jgi:hypothetical protein